MRHLLIFAIAFFSMNVSFTQETMQGLVKDITNFLELYKEQNFIKAAEYAHPEFLARHSLEVIAEVWKKEYVSEDMDIIYKNYSISSISIQKINSSSYAVIDYNYDWDIKLKTEKRKGNASQLISALSKGLGEENVTYDEKKYVVNVKHKSKYLAEFGSDMWHFAEYRKDNIEVLALLFGKDILDQLSGLDTYY